MQEGGTDRIVNGTPMQLLQAHEAGEDAKALSVLGAGVAGNSIDVNNLGLKRNYLRSNPGGTGPTYTDLMMQVRMLLCPYDC